MPPAGRDHHGVDVLAGPAHHRGLVEQFLRRRDRCRTHWRRGRAGCELFNAERAKHDPAQFYDVDYFEFIKDPIGAVEGIYRHFGIELTDAARAAMQASHAESKQGPRAPKHTYSLADYGLTAEQVKDAFKGL